MNEIYQLIGAGGDVLLVGVFGLLWRLDRRLVRLETLWNGKKKK